MLENNITSTSQRLKRQRDCIIPQQSVHTSELKTSPEQAKKRVCNYNNDITSSLSSSIKNRSNEKKRLAYSPNHTISANSESYETQKAKMQRVHDYQNTTQTDIRLENIANNLRKIENVKPISPIPKTPCVQNEDGTPQRSTTTEYRYNSNGNVPVYTKPHITKPRLTLFNKNYEDEVVGNKNLVGSSSEIIDDLNKSDDCAGIPFVKPKNISVSGLKNPLIERTQKSKLALMLSGLRGELYRNYNEDNVDSPKENEEKIKDNKLTENAITATTSISTITPTNTTVTSSSNSSSKTSISTQLSLPTKTSTNTEQTNTSASRTSSPLVGLKLSQIHSHSENVTASNVSDTKITDTIPITKVPVLGGFTFGITTSTSSIVSTVPTFTGLINSTSTTKSPISLANNLESFNQPKSTNASININPPEPKDKPLTLPIIFSNSPNSNANSSTNTVNSFKLSNPLTLGTNITPSTAVTNDNAMKPFNFSVSSQASPSTTASSPPVIFNPLTTSTISTSTVSMNKSLATTTSNITFGTATTASNMTNISSTAVPFSFNQTKTSLPGLVTTIPTSNSSTNAFTFGVTPTTTSVSSLGLNNNQEISSQSLSSQIPFDSQSKAQDSSSDHKNNTNPTNKSSNLFNSTSSMLFGTPSLSAPTAAVTFGSSTNSTEKNIFGATSSASTSIFNSSSINNSKQIFGPNSESRSSIFGESSTDKSSPATFSFGIKPPTTKSVNNSSSTTGGFSFGSSFSKTSDGGMFGLGNTIKPATTTNTSSDIFGTAPTPTIENKTFVFGGNSNKIENNSTGLFGGSSNKTSETLTAPGGFSFNPTAGQKPSTFNFGTTENTFSTNNDSNSTVKSAFSFGGTSTLKPSETSNQKLFSFGVSQPELQQSTISISNNNLVSSNIFTSTGPSKTAPPPAFNFNSGSSTNLQSIGQQTSNVFAPSSSNITAGPEKRQIRRATRRLQK